MIGIWTMIFSAVYRVEKFKFTKLLGVLASLGGIVLTSGVDISGDHDKHRGLFPHKSAKQIAVGDSLALAVGNFGAFPTSFRNHR